MWPWSQCFSLSGNIICIGGWPVVLLRGHVWLVVCIIMCFCSVWLHWLYSAVISSYIWQNYFRSICLFNVSDAGCRLCVVFKYNKRCEVEWGNASTFVHHVLCSLLDVSGSLKTTHSLLLLIQIITFTLCLRCSFFNFVKLGLRHDKT